jgi:hypothetical protein
VLNSLVIRSWLFLHDCSSLFFLIIFIIFQVDEITTFLVVLGTVANILNERMLSWMFWDWLGYC